jgi:DNA topoisomerase-1
VKISGAKIRFHFRGKSGVDQDINLTNKKLAGIVRRCQELPGQELFQYFDSDGNRNGLSSDDINDYLRAATGFDLTAKDFRNRAGSVLAARALGNLEQVTSKTLGKRNIAKAIDMVAQQLGNTRTVCQKCYIHPAIPSAYLDGSLREALARQSQRTRARAAKTLTPIESVVMSLLNQPRVVNPTSKKVA